MLSTKDERQDRCEWAFERNVLEGQRKASLELNECDYLCRWNAQLDEIHVVDVIMLKLVCRGEDWRHLGCDCR